MKKERLKQIEMVAEWIGEIENQYGCDLDFKNKTTGVIDNRVCQLAGQFAYGDMIDESAKQIEAGKHLIIEKDGYFDDGNDCWFNDLYDDYYEKIYAHLNRLTSYEFNREILLQRYQRVYSNTYFKDND